MKYTKHTKRILSDLYTPVGTFLKLRQKYHQVLLLESSDYSSKENSRSFICFKALEGIRIKDNSFIAYNQKETNQSGLSKHTVLNQIDAFIDQIEIDEQDGSDGIFGYSNFESVEFFETIELNDAKADLGTPVLRYDFYKYILIFDHHHSTLEIREYLSDSEESQIDKIIQQLNYQDVLTFDFKITGEEGSNIDGETFKNNIRVAKEHLQRGDIFQIVLSRAFNQSYQGDVFNVYRRLRSINPSPYLYFFEYGDYRIFGSSPEAQIVISNQFAEIHPIAGTFKRTGHHATDLEQAEALRKDPKENAEHVMLVDLARNDLSRHAKNVHVKKLKEIQYFSHVIHLTSIVEGKLKDKNDALKVYADTFPAGTLSGAPKYKAMQIIDKLENTKRGFYGGAIGMLGLNGDINQAILIRSFLAINNKLHYQAGAGIVIDSNEEKELQEVNNKLGALKKAISDAQNY